ncbi:alpha/beta-hydrolase [Pseudovirgaria hyperparasitica]|uniref:Alpha/beta-hydrolase n=1 Tax=Pseudovirgaria hyperparasitica TaxID=470096 RepID=A0A6A6W3G7_9PEZI|nr:alpha/beta-hydrolase [Pseudovirgaria hyperparasitica]KAF2757402.1 alpha/beta-hydrolase [Pseudovirgaria hyperparasitica]
MAKPPTKPLKILMLHGFTQSGPLFRAKTRALEKNLQKAFPAGAPDAWGWWRRKGEDPANAVYDGLEAGFERVAQVLKEEGPFDGVIGFSQGGCAAAFVASLLDEGRRDAFQAWEKQGGMRYPSSLLREEEVVHPPMKFAAIYSGFKATENPLYSAFYEPKIRTPTLHFIGTMDTVVEEKRSLKLMEQFEDSKDRVVYHPGGHFLPSSQKQYVGALIGFIKEVLGRGGTNNAEENAEDMDVPF